jgi:hypothetical protein
MSATFKNMFVGTSVLALLVLASGASAAPSLGINRPYYGSSKSGLSARSFRSPAPSYFAVPETRQSFSYEPAENGVKVNSGCHGQSVAPQAVVPQAAKKAETKKEVAVAPKTTRRSYSYEPAIQPAPQRQVYGRSYSPRKEAWQYQKTDPRRNMR